MGPPAASLRDRIQSRLLAHFGRAAASGPALSVEGPVLRRDNSLLFRATGGVLPDDLAVKECLVPDQQVPDARSAREQFNAMMQVHAKLRSDGLLRVPRPYFCDDGLAVIVAEWVGAPSLTELLTGRQPAGMVKPLIYRAGAWLRAFHDADEPKMGLFDSEHKERQARDLAADPLVGEPVFVRSAQLLVHAIRGLHGMHVRQSWLHGDFKSDNLLIQGGQTVGIDISVRDHNAVEYDIAQYLNHQALMACAPNCPRLWGRERRFAQVFLKGYLGQDTGAKPLIVPQVLAWLRLFFLLSLWRSQMRRPRAALRRWVLNRMFIHVCARLESDLVRMQRTGNANAPGA